MKKLVCLFLLQVAAFGCRVQSRAGDGLTFSSSRIAVGQQPVSVQLIDISKDGKLDLLVANHDDNTVTVLLGDGRGGLVQAEDSPFPAGKNPSDIAVADLDGDGNPDLAFANHDTNYLTVILGDGNGRFKQAPGSPFTVNSKPHPHGIAVGDFNGDGRVDLVTDNWQNNSVTVLLNDGNGKFLSPGISFPVGKMPYHKLRTADVNHDGKTDIVTTNFEGGNVSILLSDGKGGFKQPTGSPFDSHPSPFGVAIGDVNGDGKADLAVAHYSGHITDTSKDRLTVLIGAGDGTFKIYWSQAQPGKAPTSAAVGDINGDGIGDLVFANYGGGSVTIVFGGKNGLAISSESVFPVGHLPASVAVGDLNSDGKADIITANSRDNDVSVLLTK